MSRTLDLDRDPYLVRVRRHENFLARQLRKIGSHVGELIRVWALSHTDTLDPSHVPGLVDQLAKYAEAVSPWARATAARMAEEIAIRERRAWTAQARNMSTAMRRELRTAPTGEWLRRRVAEQAAEIKSIPTDAAQRIFEIVTKAQEDPARSKAYIDEIMRSGEVTRSRATMLARTMVSTVSSDLVEARARHAGSVAYVWETAKDSTVRPSHRKMQGKIVQWDAPPTLDGYTAHAGRYANCRCWPRPIWPEFD